MRLIVRAFDRPLAGAASIGGGMLVRARRSLVPAGNAKVM
jgi:hypothetical protein